MQTVADLQELQRPRRLASEPFRYTRPSRLFSEHSVIVQDVSSAFDVLSQQISGSLQIMGLVEVPSVLPSLDPYQTSPEGFLAIPSGSFVLDSQHGSRVEDLSRACGSLAIPSGSFVVNSQHGSRVEDLSRAIEVYLTSGVTTPIKTLASFVGRVESFVGDSAHVILVNEQTGEQLESRCDTELLRDNGVAVGDDFRFEVVRSKGTTSTRLCRIPPKVVSKERVEQIRASFKDRWKF
jgi:hypothetical protein